MNYLTIVAFDERGEATENPLRAVWVEWINAAGNTVYTRELTDAAEALKVLDVEIARMEELYESHCRANDYPRIVQSEAHLNGLKFARAALAASGAGEETT